MSIDEAIKHCEEVAINKTDLAYSLSDSKEKARCHNCAEEHRQLAEWLTELKMDRCLLASLYNKIGTAIKSEDDE